MSLYASIGRETELIKKYQGILCSQYELFEKVLLEYTQDVLLEERKSTPVPENKRQLIDKVYPQLKLICLGDIGNLLSELKSK